MSHRIGTMFQEGSGLSAEVYDGWNWPAFFLGPIWYLAKGMWGHGLLALLISLLTAGIGWLIAMLAIPVVGNRQYREHLASRGYRMGA